jgi:hypothetical protein
MTRIASLHLSSLMRRFARRRPTRSLSRGGSGKDTEPSALMSPMVNMCGFFRARVV